MYTVALRQGFWDYSPGISKRIRKKEEETTKYKAGTLPLNMYQTAVHRGERKRRGRRRRTYIEGPRRRSALRKYDDDSSDNDSDDFAVEEDGAIRDMQNEELGFLFASRRTCMCPRHENQTLS